MKKGRRGIFDFRLAILDWKKRREATAQSQKAQFTAKLDFVEEEADESAFWMELIMEGGLLKRYLVDPLLKEANELVAIMAASRKTTKKTAR